MSYVLKMACTGSQEPTAKFSRAFVSWWLYIWQFETSHGGSIYTREIGKCYTSGLFIPQRTSLLAHHQLNSQFCPHYPQFQLRLADSQDGKVSSHEFRHLTWSFKHYLITSPSQFHTGPQGSGAYSLIGVLHVYMATG